MNFTKLSALLLLFFFYLLPVPLAYAFDQTATVGQEGSILQGPANIAESNQQESELNLREVEKYIDRVDTDIKSAVPGLSFKDMFFKIIRGDVSWKPAEVFNNLLKYLFKEIVANTSLLGRLIVLTMICAVLHNLTSAFDRGTTGQLSYLVVYLVLSTIAIGSFALAINTGRELIDRMVSFMQAIMPLLLTLLVAMGGVASAAIFHPVILISLTVIGTLTKNVVLPLIFFSAVLGIVDNLSANFKVSRLASLLKTVAMGLLGIFSTIFLGVLAIQGVAGAVGDGVTLRTAKFAIDAFIPVVGGMFSDALESVVSSSLLIKNAAGIAGMISIFLIMGLPMLKIISLSFIYKLAGALVQPVAEGQVVNCLNEMGSSLLLVFAAVGVVGLLFFFSITILIGVGNMTVMLR
ncbi:MAG: Stage III sporulation protein AE [Desulfofundulus kuznetsovii]|nr:MAG: Stage III sporulation protein AE [Desulfotomaculum sp. 46_80]KUK85096.1 MAG: Stage III sporulation protein AE [Desulfofundulus kuznetsovii]